MLSSKSPPACSCLFFFFSSRRRHTRWPRDWSSDVCSSDLCFTTYFDVVLIHTRLPGTSSLSTVTVYDETFTYARPLVVKNPSVVMYAGPFVPSQSWNKVISSGASNPLLSPSVASTWSRRSRRFAGASPVSVLSAFKVRLRHTVRLLQSVEPYETVVWYSSCGAGWSVTS